MMLKLMDFLNLILDTINWRGDYSNYFVTLPDCAIIVSFHSITILFTNSFLPTPSLLNMYVNYDLLYMMYIIKK